MRKIPMMAVATALALSAGTVAAQQPITPKQRAELERKVAELQQQIDALQRQLGERVWNPSMGGNFSVWAPDSSISYAVFASNRGRLGVIVQTQQNPATDSIGAVVQAVTPDSPANDAGIQTGDIITVFNGTRLAAVSGRVPGQVLVDEAQKLDPGDTARITLRRGGTTKTVSVVARDMGDTYIYGFGTGPDARWGGQVRTGMLLDSVAKIRALTADSAVKQALRARELTDQMLRTRVYDSEVAKSLTGARQAMERARVELSPLTRSKVLVTLGERWSDMELTALSPELGSYFGTTNGLLVVRAPSDSSLALKGGDVILKIGDRVPTSPSHAMRIFASYQPGEKIQLDVMRNKKRITLSTTVPSDEAGFSTVEDR